MARFHLLHRFLIDDGFFFFAIISLIAGTALVYITIPYIYFFLNVQAGLQAPPADFVDQLVRQAKIQYAATCLLIITVIAVKFSFLFFFRALIRQQRKLMGWWWIVLIILSISTPFATLAHLFICPYFDERMLGKFKTMDLKF